MENQDEYLTAYREFFEHFAKTVNPNDQLPVKLASYKLVNVEVVGGIIDWTTQYLTQNMDWNDWRPQEDILTSVKEVLQEALIPNSEIQKNVQEKINVIQNLSDFTHYLLFILGNTSFSEDVRSLSGILLKNNLVTIYNTLTQESVNKIKQECLRLLRDPSREVRISISNVIVIIGRDHLKTWPELIPCLVEHFTAQNEYSEIALTTLFKLCEDLISNQKSQEEIYKVTKEVFPKFIDFLSKENCQIRQDIVRLTNQFLQDYFPVMKQSLDLELYLRHVMHLAHTEDSDLQKYICHTFVIYVDKQEQSLLPHLHDVILYLIEKCQHEDLDISLQACEFWLATAKLQSCKDILSPYISKLIPILLKNMRYSISELNIIKDSLGSDANNKDLPKDISPFHMKEKNIQDDDYFSDQEDDEDEPQGDDFDDFYMGWTLRKCSAASLDSLAVKFGDDLLTILVPYISEMLNHSDFLTKESGILALGAIAEGCLNGLKTQLPQLLQFLLQSMNDEHSVVRVITCWTISRYVSWIVNSHPESPHIYFVPVMTVLLKHFIDDNKRVQRAAISAFCIFQEEAQLKLVPYIDFIIEGFRLGFERFQCRSLYLLYDAIGALAQSVGNNLSKQQHVVKLMPPLMLKFTESDNYFDDHFIAVLECLANLIPALEVSFLPFAEAVFCHCLQVINDTLLNCLNYQEHPNEYDPPDKEPMSVAHDVLYSMALGLKSHFVKFVQNSNLVFLLYTTMQDSSNLIRQTAIALYGELVSLCYPYLSGNISEYIPLIVRNLNEHTDGVCNNAAWVIGKLCSIMGTNIQPYLPDILSQFSHILKSPAAARTMHQTVAVSLCIVFFVCPDVTCTDLETLVRTSCMLIRNVKDSEEKDIAFRGLCQVINRHPEFEKSYFIFFCDAAASWFNIRQDLKDHIWQVMINFKTKVGEENWKSYYSQFPDPLKARLHDLNCPPYLFAPLIKIIIEEIRKACKEDPLVFGFNPQERAYEPLKLMQAVMAKTNEVCLRYQDNSVLCSLPQPQHTCFIVTAHAMRNRRKRMEDRHVVIHDLSTMFNIQETSPSSYYAVFDGHAGHDAAAYSAAHLHQYLAENKHFSSDPQQALLDAFCKTDALFLEKCKVENLGSGTTAVVALLRPKEKTLYIAWAGDSLALLVNQGRILQCVNPHKPCRQDERERVHKAGGACMMWAGIWRVSGQLAVSRAIGDAPYKPYVTAVPDVREITLDGGEDFLILACDGLWDYITEDAAAQEVYYLLAENSDDTDRISKHLVQLSRYQGSTDNISVIVVFLREPSKIAADAPRWATRPANKMDVDMDQHGGQLDSQFTNGTPNDILLQKQQQSENLLLNLVDNISKSNGTDFNGSLLDPIKSPASNGTRQEFHHGDDEFRHDDFGPETDVDALDDVNNMSVISPVDKTKNIPDALLGHSALENVKAIHDAILGNSNPFEGQYNPFLQDHEKAQLETDEEIQGLDRQQSHEFEEEEQRDETPTPPIEAVQEGVEVEEINQDSDSEDEWNFIKGDEAKKGTVASQPETVVECAEEDAMSQLNPDAAEFVPVSPTRSIPSPACRALINEEVLAQSPKRPVKMVIKLPNENDFENEVKHRPSDVDELNNGHHSDSELDTTPKDPMEAFLNGKTVDDIPEFQPSSVDSTPTKPQSSDEFHFGPNAAPYTPKMLDQSEAASSTRAVFGDESTATLDMTQFSESQDFNNLANKENTDPMNMSFSEERGDMNPFNNQDDLNKIHVLPENLDEFLDDPEENKENIHDYTISDLPEHSPLGRYSDNDKAVKTTDLDQEDEKELASPLEPELQEEIEEPEPSRTPQPTHENLLGDFDGESREPMPDLLEGEPKIEAELVTKEEMTMDLIQEAQNNFENKEVLTPTHEEPSTESPLAFELRSEEQLSLVQKEAAELQKEAEPLVCPIRNEEPKQEEGNLVCSLRPQSLPGIEEPVLEYQANDVFNSEPVQKSPDFELLDDKSPVNDSPSPACEFRAPSSEPACEFRAPSSELKSPVHEVKSFAESPVPLEENIEVLQEQDVTSSVKDDISSPVSPVRSPDNDEFSRNLVIDDSQLQVNQQEVTEFADLLNTEIQSCPLPNLTEPQVCPLPTNLSFNGEPLIPSDQINNFLDQAQNQFENQLQEISEQIQIKTDNIVPEFAQQEIITPSDESKGLDIETQETPSGALVEPLVQELICPLKPAEAPKTEAESPKEAKKEVKEEAKKSTAKKLLSKAAPASKGAAPKAPAPKTSATGVSPKVPAKTGTTPAPKAPTTKPTPTLSSRTVAAPKPKTSPAAKPAAAKPLLNGDAKTAASKTGIAARKPSESTLSKTTARPATLSKTSPAPKAPISRPTTAPKVPAAAPRTAPTTARPTNGISKTASTSASKPKPAVSSTRSITSTSRAVTSTASSRVTSTVSKTATSPKPATTAPPKPKTITSAPKITRVPLTKTVTKNAELEKQNKESANKLTASKSSTLTSARTTNVTGTKSSSTTVKKTETKPLSNRTTVSKTTTTTTKSTLGKKPADIKTTTKTKTTKVEKPKVNGISATIVTEEIMVNNVVNETVNNLVNADNLVNNVSENDSNLLKDNSPIDNKLIDNNLIEVNGAD